MAGTNVATLTAKLTADTTGLKTGLAKADGEVKGFGKSSGATFDKMAKKAKMAGVAAAAAVGAMVVGSVAKFAQFEKGMNEVFTLLPDVTEQAMGEMETQVKDLSKEFGVLPDKVIPSLYQAISAGVPKDNVFEFMETATKAAIGGATELETAVDGLTSVVNAYGAENIDAAEASDLMFTAVRMGKTTMDELSRSLFQVNPVAAAMGIEFQDVTAALAAMTAQGTPTRVATTQLRQALVELGKEGTVAFDAFKTATGKTFPEFISGGGNVEQAFQAMKTQADKMGVGVGDLFGSVEAGMGVISLTSESGAAAFGSAMGEMQDAAGATDTAFATMDQGLARSWDKIKTVIGVGLIDLGERLAPFVEKIAAWLEDVLPGAIDGLMNAFDDFQPVLEDVFDIMADLGPVLKIVGEEAVATAKEILGMVGPLVDVIGFISQYSDVIAGRSTGQQSLIEQTLANTVSYAKTLADMTNPLAWFGRATAAFDRANPAGPVSDLSDEMLELKRAARRTSSDVVVSMSMLKSGTDDAMTRISDELDDSASDFAKWEKEVAKSTGKLVKTSKKDLGRLAAAWKGLPDAIKESFEEMVANITEFAEADARLRAAIQKLKDAGLAELATMFEQIGVAGVTQAEAAASDLTAAWAAEIDLGGALKIEMANLNSDSLINLTAEQARALARVYAGAFNPNLSVGTPAPAPSRIPEFKAAGGPVSALSPYIVGEKGPELFVPKTAGTIVPNGQSGDTINVYVERVETDDLPGDLSEGLTRASVAGQVDMIGGW